MKMKINDESQLRLSLPEFGPAPGCPALSASRQRRARRAGLWFRHMRQIVDRAGDWLPAPSARQRQTN